MKPKWPKWQYEARSWTPGQLRIQKANKTAYIIAVHYVWEIKSAQLIKQHAEMRLKQNWSAIMWKQDKPKTLRQKVFSPTLCHIRWLAEKCMPYLWEQPLLPSSAAPVSVPPAVTAVYSCGSEHLPHCESACLRNVGSVAMESIKSFTQYSRSLDTRYCVR